MEDFQSNDTPSFTFAFQGREVQIFPSGRSMDYVAELHEAWVVEKLLPGAAIFKHLDERMWKEGIHAKVKAVAVAHMTANGLSFNSSPK